MYHKYSSNTILIRILCPQEKFDIRKGKRGKKIDFVGGSERNISQRIGNPKLSSERESLQSAQKLIQCDIILMLILIFIIIST